MKRISIQDFVREFENIQLCHLSPDSFKADVRKIVMNSNFYNRFQALELEKQRWNAQLCRGNWTKNVTAGGSSEYQTFAMNPQFTVDLTQSDEGESACTLIVALMQREDRQMVQEANQELMTIGFEVYEVRLLKILHAF